MSAETLIPLDEALPLTPVLPPARTEGLPVATGLPDTQVNPGARLAYLFRRCQAHPLRQVLADHRGVQE